MEAGFAKVETGIHFFGSCFRLAALGNAGAPMNAGGAPIIHPIDFSDDGMTAFAHAFGIAAASKCRLYVVHVADREAADDWQAFPHVRQTLARQ